MAEHVLDLSSRFIDSGRIDGPPNRVSHELSALADDVVPHEGIRALECTVAHHIAHHRWGQSANCWAAGATVVPDLAAAVLALRAGGCTIRAAWRVRGKARRASRAAGKHGR